MKTILFLSFTTLGTWLFAQVKTAPLHVNVMNTAGKAVQGDKILFVGQTNHDTYCGVTNAAGTFLIHLPEGQVYDIRIKSIGESLEYNELEIPALPADQFYSENTLTITYEVPKHYTLNQLQFESGKATIKTSSFALMNDLVEIMLLKTAMKIQIAGHTDSDGEAADNLLLSQQRANAVRTYLINKGIAPSRIIAIGYGETKPIGDNNTAEGKAMNRRTEVSIL
ncbi:MAG: OmpA family protein [Fluviicola sp.]|nr:OmpA family protein [Fluviicola sp.]